jgi:uncharacterized membrane protein
VFKLRRAALAGAAVATVLLALAAAGVARADGGGQHQNACDVENLWAASFFSAGISNGAVFFDIFNQAPPTKEDEETEAFTLAIQLGLGNAGMGDKYHFQFETAFVSGGAMARGHGFLFVPADTGVATFVIAGRGTHPLGGDFRLMGGGDVDCVAGEGTAAQANVHVDYQNAPDDDPFVNMARCASETEGCEPPPPPGD